MLLNGVGKVLVPGIGEVALKTLSVCSLIVSLVYHFGRMLLFLEVT
jgi:hypothetical protein